MKKLVSAVSLRLECGTDIIGYQLRAFFLAEINIFREEKSLSAQQRWSSRDFFEYEYEYFEYFTHLCRRISELSYFFLPKNS
jgi:hypothetical protein